MRENLPRVSKTVEYYLRKDKKCRASDDHLYMCIVRDICRFKNVPFAELTFRDVMENRAELGIPKFESVRRSRQKLQEEYPDLRPSKPVAQKRTELEREYRQWVKKGLSKYAE